ncbi:MAG TPA: hypothetical protein VF809_03110 [Candidatus Saccharimonadales bacterium]
MSEGSPTVSINRKLVMALRLSLSLQIIIYAAAVFCHFWVLTRMTLPKHGELKDLQGFSRTLSILES